MPSPHSAPLTSLYNESTMAPQSVHDPNASEEDTLPTSVRTPRNASFAQPASAASLHPALRILHYNDVYNIFPGSQEPVGGAARFVTAIREQASHFEGEVLTVFSGDAFSPAPLTGSTKGIEIPPVINEACTDVACIGNHDMDLGLEVMFKRISETTCPWLCSNAFFKQTATEGFNKFGVELMRDVVIARGGVKIGFIGLIAKEWLGSLAVVEEEDIAYEDYVSCARRLVKYLREEQNVELVIALTHMRHNDDVKLAMAETGIDLILGGHDHMVADDRLKGIYIVKSGTDFRNFSTIDISRSTENKALHIHAPVLHHVTGDVKEHSKISALVKQYSKIIEEQHKALIGYTAVPLDGKFVSVRTQETALGNLITDIMTQAMGANIGMLNSGSLRSDRIHETGPLCGKDIHDILPYNDTAYVVVMRGDTLHAALENSVSQYPTKEGRFCQVSGIKFSFDPSKPPGARIKFSDVFLKNASGKYEPLDIAKEYTCVMKSFMAEGKDGFTCFSDETRRVIAMSSEGQDIASLVRLFFEKMYSMRMHPVFKWQEMLDPRDRLRPLFRAENFAIVSGLRNGDQCVWGVNPRIEERIKNLAPA